jgi:acyl CoA:acetate/3-ketoacid CoA transferase alpha subunit
MCGCKNPEIVWSTESKSPDGKMVAKGQALANGGFGVSGIPATFVYLNFAVGSQKSKEILEFANDSDGAAAETVEIKWLSPKQLEVAYHKDKQEIQFQAVRFGDVDITVKDLSSGMPQTH